VSEEQLSVDVVGFLLHVAVCLSFLSLLHLAGCDAVTCDAVTCDPCDLSAALLASY
jgi:hypothetical protein